jgi:biopolymer transport protein ExbB/TolQ
LSFNPIDLWNNMGVLAKLVVLALLVMSVYSAWVVIDRALVFVRARRQSLKFVIALRQTLGSGDLAATAALPRSAPSSPIARVVAAALLEYQRGLDAISRRGEHDRGDFDLVDAVNRSIDRVREREVASLKKGLGGLASVSSAAPFVGLFGTVVGIINAFRSMALSGQGGLGAVSAGISEALITTAVGLLVAIPAVMTFNYFTNTIEGMAVDINDVSSEVVAHVLREGWR